MMMPLGLGMFPGMANPVMGGAGAVGGANEQMQELMKKQLELMSQMQQQSGQVRACVCACVYVRACACVCTNSVLLLM